MACQLAVTRVFVVGPAAQIVYIVLVAWVVVIFSIERQADRFDLLIDLVPEHVNVSTLLFCLQDLITERFLRLLKPLRQNLLFSHLFRQI